jgi:hypothetical protein
MDHPDAEAEWSRLVLGVTRSEVRPGMNQVELNPG